MSDSVPLPAAGGSYIRQADGSLLPADQAEAAPPPAAAPKKAAKATSAEES